MVTEARCQRASLTLTASLVSRSHHPQRHDLVAAMGTASSSRAPSTWELGAVALVEIGPDGAAERAEEAQARGDGAVRWSAQAHDERAVGIVVGALADREAHGRGLDREERAIARLRAHERDGARRDERRLERAHGVGADGDGVAEGAGGRGPARRGSARCSRRGRRASTDRRATSSRRRGTA